MEVTRTRRNNESEATPLTYAEFSRDGRIVARDSYSNGEFQWSSCFEYDERNRLVGWVATDKDGALQWEYQYTYTDSGRLEREVSYDSEGEMDGMHTYDYENGRLVEESVYGGGGALQWSRLFEYEDDLTEYLWRLMYADGGVVKTTHVYTDRFGRVVREVHSDETEQQDEIFRYDYDAASRRIRTRVESPRGDLLRSIERTFNERGDIAREVRNEKNTDTRVQREFGYRYDDRGNWVQRLERERTLQGGIQVDEERKLIERSIVYYE